MNPLETLVAEHPTATAIAIIGIILCLIALRDILQRHFTITHNFQLSVISGISLRQMVQSSDNIFRQ